MDKELDSVPPSPQRRWRAWLKRLVLRFCFLGVVVLVLWLGARTYYAYTAGRDLQSYMAELDGADPGWRLDEIEAAREVIPEEKNSARVIAEVHDLLPKSWLRNNLSAPAGIDTTSALEDRLHGIAPCVQLDEALNAELHAELTKVLEAIDKARSLAEMPKGRHSIKYKPDFISTSLAHQQRTRDVAKLLSLHAATLAQEGNIEPSLLFCRCVANAGRSVGDEPISVSVLIRIACVGLAQRSLERSLAQGQAPDTALNVLQQMLDNESNEPLLKNVLRGERAGQHKLLDHLEAGGTNLSRLGRPKRGQSPDLSGEDINIFLMGPGFLGRNHWWTLKLMTEIVEIGALPDEEQKDGFEQFGARLRQLRTSHPMEALLPVRLIPAVQKVSEACLRHRGTLRCSVAALAAERYRLGYGHWPDSLEALVKARLLSQVPIDPFDGQPLRFDATDDGIVIYSIGHDRIDNGGNIDRRDPAAPNSDLGFELWNPNKRRQPSEPVKQE